MVMTEFLELGRKLLPVEVVKPVVNLHDPQAVSSGFPKRDDRAGKMITAITQTDAWILNYLAAPVGVEPYLVFDDKNRTITFFKTEIAFDDLPKNTRGGLKLMRVFVRFPHQAISAGELIKFSGLKIKPDQLPAYISRFRTAVTRLLKEKGKSGFGSDLGSTWEKKVFIEPAREARAEAHTKEPYYELALPSNLVRYIAAD
jgi:hypothetical protein